MKIVIVGAGIAGLSAYLFLHKHLVQESASKYHLKIYEAYDVLTMRYDARQAPRLEESMPSPNPNSEIIGSAIGISKNGLAVLSRIDDGLVVLKGIESMGNKVAKWKIGTARGWKMAEASVQSSASHGEESTDTIMIARQVAWAVLRNQVLSIDAKSVDKKRITAVENLENGKTLLRFSDGTDDTADLVIGADGLRSIVRRTIFQDRTDFHSPSWMDAILQRPSQQRDYVTPHYEGLTGLGGCVPGSVLKDTGYEQDAMSITFGPNGFFGHGYIGSVGHLSAITEAASREDSVPLAAWWSTFSSDTPRPYERKNESKSDSIGGIDTMFDRERALQEMLKRHGKWADPAIQAILQYIKENVAIEHIYPTYTTPELPTWKSETNNLVLIGDAAHALQPSSGQGACQALEDAEALALLLKHYLHEAKTSTAPVTGEAAVEGTKRKALGTALSKFQQLRMPRVAAIYKQSQRISSSKMDMGVVQEHLMYFFIWLTTKMGLMKKYNGDLFEYDLPSEVARVVTAMP